MALLQAGLGISGTQTCHLACLVAQLWCPGGLLVAGLVTWQYSDQLAGFLISGLLGFAVWLFILLVLSGGVFAGSMRTALRLQVLIGLMAYWFGAFFVVWFLFYEVPPLKYALGR